MKGNNMDIKAVVAFGAIAALAIYNEVACRINQNTIEEQNKKIESLVNLNVYFATKLDEAQVPLTEFDRIAMQNL